MNGGNLKICIFRIGSLGDNLIAIPAIKAIKAEFKYSEMYLLSNKNSKTNVTGKDVFDGSGLFDGFINYPSAESFAEKLLLIYCFFSLLINLRKLKFDLLVYLAPSERSKYQIKRDLMFFKWAKINKIVGTNQADFYRIGSNSSHAITTEREAELMLDRLKELGIKVSNNKKVDFYLNTTINDIKGFNTVMTVNGIPSNKQWVGVAPGSNMPSKTWPLERYEEVLRKLILNFGLWPIVFGGISDFAAGEQLISNLGVGTNLAGKLTVRQSAVGLKKCLFYLGNDTGTMHLAASVGTRCVAIFSARDRQGKWVPYGTNNIIIRKSLPCEGCMLTLCVKHKNECLTTIQTNMVYKACLVLINQTLKKRRA